MSSMERRARVRRRLAELLHLGGRPSRDGPALPMSCLADPAPAWSGWALLLLVLVALVVLLAVAQVALRPRRTRDIDRLVEWIDQKGAAFDELWTELEQAMML